MAVRTNRRAFLQRSAALSGALALGEPNAFGIFPHVDSAEKLPLFKPESLRMERQPCALFPLAPGVVAPGGWIRAWATNAANGITGHLDEHSATFNEAWKGYAFSALGAHSDGTGWPLEQCSYWLDGAIRLAYMLQDQALIQKVSARLDRVVNGVLNGGDSFIYWCPPAVLKDPFNSWAHSHMGRALVAYYQGSNQPEVLDALTKVYRKYPVDDLSSTFHRSCGAVNLDAMSDTYRMSGDSAILERILAYAQRDSYRDTADAWANGHLEAGHNVVFYEQIRTPALLFPWTGNRRDLAATVTGLGWNDKHNLLPLGVSSGEEYQAGIGSTRNVETCNIPASIWTNLWLARITGESTWLDRIEHIFFNAGPGPVSHDFKIMSYYQRPNRYSRTLPAQEPANPGKGSYQFTDIGDPVLCCVGNLNRVIPFYVTHMWMTTRDGGLVAALHGPSQVRATVGDNVRITVDSNTRYPFEENIEFVVNPERPVTFPLYLRIPAWACNASIWVNGDLFSTQDGLRGFQKISREWSRGDRVRLYVPMSIRLERGYETPYPEIPYFSNSRDISKLREIHNPYVSVFYGPLLFSLPIPSLSPNAEIPGTQINYSIDVMSDKPNSGEADIFREPVFSFDRFEWIPPSPIQLGINAQEIPWNPTEMQPLPNGPMKGKKTRIVLVPYGCTKFGISMFPRTA